MIITLDPPLLCSQLVAARHRCTNAATIGRIAEQTDGSYQLQTFCPACATAAGLAPEYDGERNQECCRPADQH